ncbi:MAG: OmpH family outer membrane protein [Thermodesulfobacteriota bacterium]
MKRCVLFATTIALFLSLNSPVMGQEPPKIGVIDLQRCLQESMEGKKATERLKKKKAELQKKLDKKQQDLLELRREFEKQSMMLSMDAQERKRKTVERKARELEYYLQDLNEDMAKSQEQEKKKIFDELGTVIEDLGSQGGYAIILEKRAGGVLYGNEAVDITDQVITAYDQVKQRQGINIGD